MSAVVIGTLLTVLGLCGLTLASGAIDAGMAHFGLCLFGFAVFFDWWLIKAHFDGIEAAR
jgi:hypothetical protein